MLQLPLQPRHFVNSSADVLPKAPPLISRVRSRQDALANGFAQRAWHIATHDSRAGD